MSRTRARRLPALATVLVSLLLVPALSSCGGDDGSDGAASDTVSETESDTTDDAADDAEDVVADDAPAGGESVDAAGISFDVPEDWKVVDAEDVAEGQGDNPVMAELGDRMGMTAEQLQTMVGQFDLFVFDGGGAKKGFLDNINVIGQPGAQMPSESELEMQMLQIGADLGTIEQVDTGAGETTVVDYTLDINQPVEVVGRSVNVVTDDGLVTISISTSDEKVADELADRVLATLETE
jgi:hypothetical protein